MKRLIINADDFGMTAGINHAITEAHRRGAVTSATMMVNGGAFAEAVQMAHASP
ncbi:MAG TPA: ChbG/HpnK family deacetylase, partial [Terriglobales bacterium]|nr:ChbG/HpnK family deacetylase [Terriglobales bacterium]